MAEQVPSIGRVVHYVSHGTPDMSFRSEHRAAIITAVCDPAINTSANGVSLCVLNPTGIYFLQWCEYDETATKPGTWHWPEFVPAKR